MEEPRVARAYTGVGRGRFRAKHDRGRLIELADSSHWRVSPGHEVFTTHWKDDSEITVVPGQYSDYPYDLINQRSGERVPARYLGFSNPDFGWSVLGDE